MAAAAAAGGQESSPGEASSPAERTALRAAEKRFALVRAERARGGGRGGGRRRVRLVPVRTAALHAPASDAIVDFDCERSRTRHGVETKCAGGQRCCTLKSAPGVVVLPEAVGKGVAAALATRALDDWLSPELAGCNMDAHDDPSQRERWYTATHGRAPAWASLAAPAGRKSGRLRWTTLGRQFNWNSRGYDEAGAAAAEDVVETSRKLPEELRELGSRIVRLAHASGALARNCEREPVFDAAIVNFYAGVSDRLCFHKDDTEEDLSQPIVSVSLGVPCVFLIGGEDKQTEPTPLLLRSGDVLLLSGPARFHYHAVPRILTGDAKEEGKEDAEVGQRLRARPDAARRASGCGAADDATLRAGDVHHQASVAADQWLARRRININLRHSAPVVPRT